MKEKIRSENVKRNIYSWSRQRNEQDQPEQKVTHGAGTRSPRMPAHQDRFRCSRRRVGRWDECPGSPPSTDEGCISTSPACSCPVSCGWPSARGRTQAFLRLRQCWNDVQNNVHHTDDWHRTDVIKFWQSSWTYTRLTRNASLLININHKQDSIKEKIDTVALLK